MLPHHRIMRVGDRCAPLLVGRGRRGLNGIDPIRRFRREPSPDATIFNQTSRAVAIAWTPGDPTSAVSVAKVPTSRANASRAEWPVSWPAVFLSLCECPAVIRLERPAVLLVREPSCDRCRWIAAQRRWIFDPREERRCRLSRFSLAR